MQTSWEGCLKGMEGYHFLLRFSSCLIDYLKWPQGDGSNPGVPNCIEHIGPHFLLYPQERTQEPNTPLPAPSTNFPPCTCLASHSWLEHLGHNGLLCSDLGTEGKFMLVSAGPLRRG